MVWKLLRKNISPGQIVGYSLASIIGLTIVICALKFYCDVKSVFSGDDSLVSKDYIIISKPVTTGAMLGDGSATTFSQSEIDDIKRQPWAERVGEFTSADFHVNAAIEFGGRGMSTQLFFEALPDTFLDIAPQQWTFSPPASPDDVSYAQISEIEIPVIISREYLALYNFGYAAGRGMPQLNEKLIQSVPLTFYLSGNGRSDAYKGRIVGFSSRLNTVAVPDDFLRWANRRYAGAKQSQPSRLIIQSDITGDPSIKKYMERHSYDIAGDRLDNSRVNYFLRLATSVVVAVGVVITGLALFILMLSIYLLLQKNRQKLHDLMVLGYTPTRVARPYYILVAAINVGILAVAVVIMFGASHVWTQKLTAIDIRSASPCLAITVGAAITAVVTTVNCLAIRHIVRKNFRLN